MSNVPITKAIEPWVELHLADGSILKARMNIAAVTRVDGVFDQQGRPAYVFDPQMQVALIPSEALCTKKPLQPSGVPGQFVEAPPGSPLARVGEAIAAAAAPVDQNARAAAEKLMGGGSA